MLRTTTICLVLTIAANVVAAEKTLSHPPLRHVPAANRPMGKGPAFFVDAVKGSDAGNGAMAAPWKTAQHGIAQLKAGETLYLRAGTYYEHLNVRVVGDRKAPITIRSFPGEQAIIDGGIREFFDEPADAWTPFSGGAPAEYRSTRRYPNLRNVVASFGDSMVGLQTYYHAQDLRAPDEFMQPRADKTDVQPLWCGPGLWYDRNTGFMHARLSHTQAPGLDNYRGATDPRKLPIVLAEYRALPLHVDRAEHVRFQDLVIRGGGYETVNLDQASDIEFDNVTIWCGTFGLSAVGTQRLKFHRSALYGNIAPWTTRFESGLNTYPGRTQRDITRLNTHALLVTNANPEYSVYHFPFNDDWEISHSEFTDASDGLYLGGISMRFHHNLVWNTHDDGVYLSPMYERPKIGGGGATLHIYQNYFGRCLTMFAFGGTMNSEDTIYFCRNIVDMRSPIWTGRGRAEGAPALSQTGKLTGDHGSPPWSSKFAYHNTIILGSRADTADMWLARGAVKERPRRVFNNIFVHANQLAPVRLLDNPDLQVDGNLYWQPNLDAKQAAVFFKTYRASPAYENSKKAYAPGFDSNSIVADPRFAKLGDPSLLGSDGLELNDYRLQQGSPAIDAGVTVLADWPDPLRELDRGKPDIGAIPSGAAMWKAGR